MSASRASKVGSEIALDAEWSGGQTVYDRRRGDRPYHLRDAKQDKSDGTDDTDEEERQRDVWVEQSACNAVEQPCSDEETHSHGCRYVQHMLNAGPALECFARCCLNAAETEKEEKGRSDELDGGSLGIYRK